MKKLPVTRYIQDGINCGVAACAAVGNYYNENINLKSAHKVANEISIELDQDGIFSGEMLQLLNKMGFQKVKMISCDMGYLDFSWVNEPRQDVIEKLKQLSEKEDKCYGHYAKASESLANALGFKGNSLIIDRDFKKHIVKHVNLGRPVVISFNFQIMHKEQKWDANYIYDDVNGVSEEHAVVCNGVTKTKLGIVDSLNKENYPEHLKRLESGIYNVQWEAFLTSMGWGDVIIPYDYNINRSHEEFR